MYVILTCLFELLWIYGFSAAENCFHFLLIAIIILTDFYFLEKACEDDTDRNGLCCLFGGRNYLYRADGYVAVSG